MNIDLEKAYKILEKYYISNLGGFFIRYDNILSFYKDIDSDFSLNTYDFGYYKQYVEDNELDGLSTIYNTSINDNTKEGLLNKICDVIEGFEEYRAEIEKDRKANEQKLLKRLNVNSERKTEHILLEPLRNVKRLLKSKYQADNRDVSIEEISDLESMLNKLFETGEYILFNIDSFIELKNILEGLIKIMSEDYSFRNINVDTITKMYSCINLIEDMKNIDKEQAEQDAYFENIPKEELPPEEEIIEQEEELPKEEQQQQEEPKEEQTEQTENNQFKKKTLIKRGFSQEQIYNLKTALEQNNLFFGSIEAWQNLFSDNIQDKLTITANTKNDCSALILLLQEEGIFNNGGYSLIEKNLCFKNDDGSYLTQQDISKNKTDGGKKIKDKYGVNTDKIKKIIKEVKKGANVKKQ